MKKLIMAALGCAALASATAAGAQGAPAGGKYDILGLRLGMTAKQAEAVIAQRLHVHPGSGSGSYNVMPGPGHYVPGRPYVGGFVVNVGRAQLILNFTEVPRGAGQGPEELWHITYAPALATTADTAAFVAQVIKKFGPPTKIMDPQDYYWASRSYDNPLAFSQANIPVLNLTTYNGKLELGNDGISHHMESVYNSRRTTPQPL